MSSIKKTPSEDGKSSLPTALPLPMLTRPEIASTLTHLKLSTTSPQKPLHKPKSKPVADSWDDEDASSGSDTETESADTKPTLSPISTVASNEISPHPPPPTPASPTPFELPYDNAPGARGRGSVGLDKRPEKTTAVAGRLIAGALGVRAPKRTEEEREFDKAVREKERRRRAEEKEREAREKEEVERRKKAVWDD
jgi:hypothetical protein